MATKVKKMYVLDNGRIDMLTDNKVTDGNNESSSIPIHSFLFETECGYVLFDTGCDPDGMEKNWPEWLKTNPYVADEQENPVGQLAILSLKPSDISYVVMSHLHVDHAGTLKEFVNSEVYVSRAEFTGVMKDYADGKLDGFYVKADVEGWLKGRIKWNLIHENINELNICEGLTILHFGSGHAYGMCGILAELPESGNYILAADALYTKEHLGPPAKVAGIVYDEKGYFDTIEKIRELAAKKNAKILFGHDMNQFKGLKKVKEGFYK